MPPARPVLMLALVLAATSATPSLAGACTMDTQVIRSFIDVRSPKVAAVVATRRPDARSFEQTVRLRTGTSVTFSVGGCEHFGFGFAFRPVAGISATTPLPELAGIARAQLASVPIRNDDRVWVEGIEEALSSEEALADAERLDTGFALGMGETRYTFEVPEPGVLEIRSDFAL